MKTHPVSITLGIGFGVLILIVVAMGYLAIERMAQVNNAMDQLVKHQWAKVQLSQRALSYSARNNRATLQVLLMSDHEQIDRLLVERAQNTEKISKLVEEIEQNMDSARERELLAAVKAARTPYVESYKQALKLQFTDNKSDEARNVMVTVTLPLLIRYHAAWDAFVQFQGEQMDQTALAARTMYAATRKQTFYLILFAVVGASAIALFVTRKIEDETTERERAQKALLRANNELESRVQQRTAELAGANAELHREVIERQRTVEERDRFFALSLDMLCITDSDGFHRRVNPACTTLLGWTADELMSRPFLEFVHPDDRALTMERLQQLVLGQPVNDFELRCLAKDGTDRWTAWTASAVDQNGLFYTCGRDIHERKQTEVRLRLQTAALEAAANAVAITDRSGTIIWVNPAFTELTGYRADEAIGQNLRLLKSDKHEPDFYRDLWATVTSGKVWHGDLPPLVGPVC